MADHSEAIAEFISVTGASSDQAQQFLALTDFDVQGAVASFYQSQEDSDNDEDLDEANEDEPAPLLSRGTGPSVGGGRRLGEEGDPLSGASASSIPVASGSRPPQPKKKFASLRDLQSDGHAGHGHDDDDADSDKEQEFYAGGDKSGLAVQDPSSGSHRDQIQRLMNTARQGGRERPPRDDAPAPRPSHFTGSGQTLGGDDVESQVIPASSSRPPRPLEMVERILHLWEDGFSIDDGDLYRYDNPANRRILDMINAGSAPMDLMNVQDGQAVDVKLDDHRGQKFVQPKKKYKPFEGSGNRLGSPTPGSVISTSISSTAPPLETEPTDAAPSVDVDDSQPTLSLQIRLADGTRLPSRFNATHNIGDVYAFVERAVSGGQPRPYVLATTFPTRDLTDKSQVLGEMAEFKRGGVVVQKWT